MEMFYKTVKKYKVLLFINIKSLPLYDSMTNYVREDLVSKRAKVSTVKYNFKFQGLRS